MKIFDRYVLKNLVLAALFVSVTLAAVIFLTQSLRFLELVIEAGATSGSFWFLTFLALPRFFEIILPLSLMAATIFIYNRMSSDSELVAIRTAGYSPLRLSRPAIVLAMIVTVFLWAMTMYAAPKSLSRMQEMRQIIKAQFSTFLFREGVFTQAGKGLTVYIRKRNTGDGSLQGIMIHDSREEAANPSTIMAQRGVLVATDEGHQVLVYDGSRHEYDTEKDTLHRLDFERYTIDLPDGGPVRKRWREPDERTIFELLNPNMNNERDAESLREFRIEIHRRSAAPLLALTFVLVSCAALLIGPADRRGQGRRIALAVAIVMVLQGGFLAAFNLSRQTDWGLPLMHATILVPLFVSAFLLTGFSERFRRQVLYASEATP